MSHIQRSRRLLSIIAGSARYRRQPATPSASCADRAGARVSADMCSARNWLSFRRIVDIPFWASMAALQSWQPAGQDGDLQFGQSLMRGLMECDHDLGTCQIEVRLARGPLRRPLRMRLDIDHWSPASTAFELISLGRARPTAGYFRAGHRLLDSVTQSLPMQLMARRFDHVAVACPAPTAPSRR